MGRGGDPGDMSQGELNVQALIDEAIMKEWIQDGVRFCAYRSISVGREEAVEISGEVSKAFILCYLVMCLGNTSLISVFCNMSCMLDVMCVSMCIHV